MNNDHLIIEVRAAEGGDDAKTLVATQVAIYCAPCYPEVSLASSFSRSAPALPSCALGSRRARGVRRRGRRPPVAARAAQREARSSAHQHRDRRDPRRAERDRVAAHRSARARHHDVSCVRRNGGQNMQKTDSAVQIRHIPSGLIVRCETERSQTYNKATALSILRARLHDLMVARASGDRADSRRRQIGSGQRGDKRRTIAVQRDSVVDHVSGRAWRFADYERGKW